MKLESKYKYGLMILFLVSTICVSAQDRVVGDENSVLIANPGQFFVALVCGIILAMAFQLLLTNLAVAIGLNMVDVEGENQPEKKEKEGVGKKARKVTTAFGLWTIITASIALFCASWLAAEISQTINIIGGVIVGLIIWGLFYISMVTFEVTAISSMIGSMIKLATAGLKTAYQTTASIFTKSDEKSMADSAKAIASAVREEMEGLKDDKGWMKSIQGFIQKIKPSQNRGESIKSALAEKLHDSDLKLLLEHEGPLFDKNTLSESLAATGLTKKKIGSLVDHFMQAVDSLKKEATSNKSSESKIPAVVEKGMEMVTEGKQKLQKKVEDFFADMDDEQLTAEGFKEDFKKLFTEPSEGMEALKQRLSKFDKTTVANMLSKRKDISKEKAQKAVKTVSEVIENLREITKSGKNYLMDKLGGYLNSLNRPELEYEGIQEDLQKLFSDPKASYEALKQRFQSMDRNTLKAVISSRKDMSEDDAEAIIARLEQTRDTVLEKAKQMEEAIKKRVNEAKEETLHQIDEVRKTAASAAWWAFGTACVSGVAAACGGLLAVHTIF
jgi:CHASE3 domain sensor protein